MNRLSSDSRALWLVKLPARFADLGLELLTVWGVDRRSIVLGQPLESPVEVMESGHFEATERRAGAE